MSEQLNFKNQQSKRRIPNTFTLVVLILAVPLAFGFTAGTITSPIAFLLALAITRTVSWTLTLTIMVGFATIGAIYGVFVVVRTL